MVNKCEPLLGEALGPPISAYTYFGRGTVCPLLLRQKAKVGELLRVRIEFEVLVEIANEPSLEACLLK
jgi:hypothetical protein